MLTPCVQLPLGAFLSFYPLLILYTIERSFVQRSALDILGFQHSGSFWMCTGRRGGTSVERTISYGLHAASALYACTLGFLFLLPLLSLLAGKVMIVKSLVCMHQLYLYIRLQYCGISMKMPRERLARSSVTLTLDLIRASCPW